MFRLFAAKSKDQIRLTALKDQLETYKEHDSISGLWDQVGVALICTLEDIADETGIAEERLLYLEGLTPEEVTIVAPALVPSARVLEISEFYDQYCYGLLSALFSLKYQFPDATEKTHRDLISLRKDYTAFYLRVVERGQAVRAELYSSFDDFD